MKAIDDIRGAWRRAAFAWGEHDCILSVCNYVREVTGTDPAAPWRGSYADEAGAHRICEQHGGAWRLFRYGMARAGFGAGEAREGAAVMARIGATEVAGIYLGDRFAGRVAFVSVRGLCEVRAPILEAWPIEVKA